jgi:hypothetical protein
VLCRRVQEWFVGGKRQLKVNRTIHKSLSYDPKPKQPVNENFQGEIPEDKRSNLVHSLNLVGLSNLSNPV